MQNKSHKLINQPKVGFLNFIHFNSNQNLKSQIIRTINNSIYGHGHKEANIGNSFTMQNKNDMESYCIQKYRISYVLQIILPKNVIVNLHWKRESSN